MAQELCHRGGVFHTESLRHGGRLLFEVWRIAIDYPFDISFQQFAAEVDQEADTLSGKPDVSQDLLFVDTCKVLNGFCFYNNEILDDYVSPKAFREKAVSNSNRHGDLTLNFQASEHQSIGQQNFVNRFQKTGPTSR